MLSHLPVTLHTVKYEFFLAKRYAFTKRSHNFITIISVISTLGIMVGVAALICVLSVFNGFSSVVTGILVNFDPHIRIVAAADSSAGGTKYLANVQALLEKIRTQPDIRSVAAVNREKAVIVHYTLPRIAMLSGIDERDVKKVSGLSEAMTGGTMQLDSEGIILGQLLADNMAIIPGDTIEVLSPNGMERILTEPVVPKSKNLIVRGIFGTNNREYDAQNAYVGLSTSKDLFEIPDGAATSIEIRLDDIHNSIPVKQELQKIFPASQYSIQTWYDLHTDLYSVMEMERWIAYAILILIVAVASFSIFSALTLTVYEKKRDIGLLLALGAETANIRRVYLYQGLLTGVLGVILGSLIGLGIIWAQKEFGFFKLDTSVYIIPALPVELRWTDFISVSLGALILVMLATIFPARRAAMVSPADALRWE
jgi:lipoprotein-releasing system permease protein